MRFFLKLYFVDCILSFVCVSRECTTGNIPDVNFFCMPKYFWHMAESTSGEDQVNPVFWLATCTIPERVRGADLAWNFSPWSCKQNYKSFMNEACLVKMTSNFFCFYWLWFCLDFWGWIARFEQILSHDQLLIKPFYIAKSKTNDLHSHSFCTCKDLVTKLILFPGQNSFETMHLAGDLQLG